MSFANKGFELNLNLAESIDDNRSLDNLGGGNISQDIFLFVNNKKNVSRLEWKSDDPENFIQDNQFIFSGNNPFIFTNGDQVKVQGSSLGNITEEVTYYIVDYKIGLGDLKNKSSFGLSLTIDGNKIALGNITNTITFIRNDEVTQENIINIATPETLEQGSSIEADKFRYDIGGTFTNAFNTVDSNIDSSNFIRGQKYTKNTSVLTRREIKIEGVNSVKDPSGFNNSSSNLGNSNSPGVYITDPFSELLNLNSSKTRAYSTSEQPWTEVTGEIVTKSSQVNIGDLYFEKEIDIVSFDGITSTSGAVNLFTHKLPIRINGVDYFLLIRQV
jgi:hypothetical protein